MVTRMAEAQWERWGREGGSDSHLTSSGHDLPAMTLVRAAAGIMYCTRIGREKDEDDKMSDRSSGRYDRMHGVALHLDGETSPSEAQASPGAPAFGQPREAAPSGGDVALLIDWENLKWSLQNNYRETPNVSSLVEAAREYGRLVVARAYADWTMPRLVPDAPNLYRAGIEPVYVPGRHPVGATALKNSADVRLAVDAVELCVRLPHVDTYLLVTGDGDLIHALNFLRLNGRRGVVVGVGDTMNALLSAAADAILLYERDIEPLRAPSIDGQHAPPLAPVARPFNEALPGAPPVEEVIDWVVAMLGQGGAAPYPLTELGQHLKRLHRFDARQWYNLRLKDVLLLGQQAGRLHLSVSGGVDHVSLPQAKPGPNATPDAALEPTEAPGAPAWQAPTTIGLDALSEDDARALLTAIRGLEERSDYLVFKYVADNLTRDSVLPQLSRDQIDSLVQDLIAQNLLQRHRAEGVSPLGEQFTFSRLALNLRHPTVRLLLDLPPVSADVAAPRDPVHQALLDIVQRKGMLSAVGRRALPMTECQAHLEMRLGTRGLGPRGASGLISEAEGEGVVRLLRREDGTALVTTPDLDFPPLDIDEDVAHHSIWYDLGDRGLGVVLRAVAEAEDKEGAALMHNALVRVLLVALGTLTAPEAHTGRASGHDQLALRRANSLAHQHLIDARIVRPLVRMEIDEDQGRHRVERRLLEREHPLVRRALS